MRRWLYSCVLLLVLLPGLASAAELVVLTNANWDRFAPEGKEVDCILGDYALKSDRLWVVVAQPLPTRNANMFVKQVAGAVLDLTLTDQPNDQLSAFYPGKRQFPFSQAKIVQGKGKTVVLHVEAAAQDKEERLPAVRVEYELTDGQPFLLVRTIFHNTLEQPLTVPLEDELRMDKVETRSRSGATDLFWVHDRHFEQAYGLMVADHDLITRSTVSQSVLQYTDPASDKASITLAPGQKYTLVRRLFPGRHLLQVRGEVAAFRGQPVVQQGWRLVDPQYRPVVGAEITLSQDETIYGTGRSDAQGWLRCALPLEKFTLKCKSIGRPTVEKAIDLTGMKPGAVVNTQYLLERAAEVAAHITDVEGQPIPCKVAFNGLEGTPAPYWGPPTARHGVVNLYYSANGQFTVPIAPGKYEAVISYGPEYNLVRQVLEVKPGTQVPLQAQLRRAFSTPGWVSTDFHGHSSPSGDNVTDQRGRVLNLLCEQIEFAPCTEHNRIDSYTPHLKALGVEHLLGTCCGIELTGIPLPLNHHNAFPLEQKPRTQDGGGPLPDANPAEQIRRLAEWGNSEAERLVQQNHPDIGWLFFDKNGDGKPDSGYKNGFRYMHVMEVHPIHEVLDMKASRTTVSKAGIRKRNNTVFNWLQLLNLGYRIPGVVNTDSHYNYHGSGGLRNYVRCDARTPGSIDPLEIVRHAKQGHIIISNGPFLEVKLEKALPGDDLRLAGGKGRLQIKAYCADWYDVDRVQVLINGRPDAKLNFTRRSHPKLFKDGGLRFAHALELHLPQDAHVIVAAVGTQTTLGDVMGPMWGRQQPAAISNPIFVDVDGGGCRPNRDPLGHPLPVKGG